MKSIEFDALDWICNFNVTEEILPLYEENPAPSLPYSQTNAELALEAHRLGIIIDRVEDADRDWVLAAIAARGNQR
jgi:hypothetical protein